MSPSEQHDTPEAARRNERQGFLDLEQGELDAALPPDQPLPAPHKWPARVRPTQPASTQHDAPDPAPDRAALPLPGMAESPLPASAEAAEAVPIEIADTAVVAETGTTIPAAARHARRRSRGTAAAPDTPAQIEPAHAAPTSALLDLVPAAEAPHVSALEAGPALAEFATAASTATESASIESAAADSQIQPVAALPSPDASTITVDRRTVKFAAWMLGLTAGFGCVTMVCAIWGLVVLLHPPVPPASSASAVPTARTGLVPPAPAASAPLAAAAPAKTETASAAAAPPLVHHYHHKIKPKPRPKPKPKARTTT